MLTRGDLGTHGRFTHPPTIRIEEIPSLAHLEALREEWSSLWKCCPDATPFQAPAWILAWARHFAPDRTRALALWRRGVLSALVPFFTWDGTLLLAGTGPTDYCDGLFAPGHKDEAAHMLDALGNTAERELLRLDLQQLRERSPLLLARTPAGWLEEVRAGPECPVARLSGSAGLDGISRERLKKLGRIRRHLQDEDGYALGPGTDEDLGNAFGTLERLHARRWEGCGSPGVLADALMRAFVCTVIPELNAAGLLRIAQLKIGNRTIAIVVAVQSGRAAYYYLGGFDPEWSHVSPGTLAIVAAMKQAATEGADEFHFLRGGEAYKYHLGARDRPTYRRVLSRS
ncbi:MAG: glycosyl transferase, group 1 [Gammaproteobacteria bacterium]|jgi:CelD/BcsL family acetyltransferase involved in cellulose biosynthesis|nr:glycosyl transferase, group 1 [Gammaproteobacteria bacterium]